MGSLPDIDLRPELYTHHYKNEFECEHCEKILSSRSALNHHKNTAKYCLILQNKILEEVLSYRCDDCEYVTGNKTNITNHLKICKKIKRGKKNTVEEEKSLKEQTAIMLSFNTAILVKIKAMVKK